MEIKIESGANVQITDKPIVNNIVYGDVVQRKEVPLPEQSGISKNNTKLSVQDISSQGARHGVIRCDW